jgi:transposase InsO family protein
VSSEVSWAHTRFLGRTRELLWRRAVTSGLGTSQGANFGGMRPPSDNAGPRKGATMLAKLKALGVAASFSRPRTSDDNPCSESPFATLKSRVAYPSSAARDRTGTDLRARAAGCTRAMANVGQGGRASGDTGARFLERCIAVALEERRAPTSSNSGRDDQVRRTGGRDPLRAGARGAPSARLG